MAATAAALTAALLNAAFGVRLGCEADLLVQRSSLRRITRPATSGTSTHSEVYR